MKLRGKKMRLTLPGADGDKIASWLAVVIVFQPEGVTMMFPGVICHDCVDAFL
jgi:hypothetical protein